MEITIELDKLNNQELKFALISMIRTKINSDNQSDALRTISEYQHDLKKSIYILESTINANKEIILESENLENSEIDEIIECSNNCVESAFTMTKNILCKLFPELGSSDAYDTLDWLLYQCEYFSLLVEICDYDFTIMD